MSADFETKNTAGFGNVIWSLTISYDGKKAFIYHNCNGLKKSDVPVQAWKDLADPTTMIILQNGVFDGFIAAFFFKVRIRNIWDTMLCEIVANGVSLPPRKKVTLSPPELALRKKYGAGLEEILPRYKLKTPNKKIREQFIDRPIGIPFTKKEKEYMVEDVLPLFELQRKQQIRLEKLGLMAVAELENRYLEKKRIPAKVKGINFDPKIWRKIADENIRLFNERHAKLPKTVENWNSEKQVKAFFAKKYKIIIPTYRSKSPDVDDLDTLYLKTRNKVLGDFIMLRELANSVKMFGLNWFEEDYIEKDGRIRPNVTQIKETGRVSYMRPNLQQLPGYGRKDQIHEQVMKILYKQEVRSKPQHRRAFIPSPGNVFVIGDFGGQEIGVMAAASGERMWIDALLRGDDIHALTATKVFTNEWNKSALKTCTFPKKCSCPNHVSPLREDSKIINFQQAYGGGATRFAKSTGKNMLESRIVIARYKKEHKHLTTYLEKNAASALSTGVSYSADPYRRMRLLRAEVEYRLENQGKNNPIQAGGANMLKRAASNLNEKYYCPLEVHDEIALDVPIEQALEAAKHLKKIMEEAADYITGIKGSVKAEPKIQTNLMKDLKKCSKLAEVKDGEHCFIPKL